VKNERRKKGTMNEEEREGGREEERNDGIGREKGWERENEGVRV
jgi:hypothetical protein